MIISHEHKFVFIKTRKTSGSTIEKLLLPYLDKTRDTCTGSINENIIPFNHKGLRGHVSYSSILTAFPETKGYWFFTIERNPWDKVLSSYYWYNTTGPLLDFINSSECPNDWNRYRGIFPKGHAFTYEKMLDLYSAL